MDQALQLSLQADSMHKGNEKQSMMAMCDDDEDINCHVNLDFLKWMLSFSWNQGVKCFQKEGDREMGKRYF